MENEPECCAAATPVRDSFSSGGSSMSTSSSSIPMKTALNDCSSAWIHYLKALNNLCTAGTKLGNSITILEQYGSTSDKSSKAFAEKNSFHNHPSTYLTNSWNDLARATAVATNTVKSHIAAVLQDFVTLSTAEQLTICEIEQKRIRDHNDLIIMENAQIMINVQHQFCVASCDAFSSLTCCFVCQSPVGFPHEQDCTMIKQKNTAEQRSQTPSPHFGGANKIETTRGNSFNEQRPIGFGSISGQIPEQSNFCMEQTRGPSPQQNFRDTIPLQAIFEITKGPLPNPGHLLAMKMPFYRGTKSPLNFPLFPLNGQRRWSEAAAGEVIDNSNDTECQMRRWSMPWEASKSDQNTVTWYQTRIMPVNNLRLLSEKINGSEKSIPHTPDSNWHSSIASHDGLTEAIQLLSCKAPKIHTQLQQQPNSTYAPDSFNCD